MSDYPDAVPTPPGGPEALHGGFPKRELGYGVVAAQVHFEKMPHATAADGDEVWVFIIDTTDNRNVSYWSKGELEKWLRMGMNKIGVIPDGLVIADVNDLKNLG